MPRKAQTYESFREIRQKKWSGDTEVHSGIPAAIPPGAIKPPTFEEMVQRFISQEFAQLADEHGYETFEEADDFEPEEPEEMLPLTKYELSAIQESNTPPMDGVNTNPQGQRQTASERESERLSAESHEEPTTEAPMPHAEPLEANGSGQDGSSG